MPCACKKPLPAYPGTTEWGPTMWKILHAFAERSGKITNPIFHNDERRQWSLLLTELPKVIPCDHCREHATAWIASHPVTALRDLPYAEVHDWLVNYLCTFHNAVNTRLSKPSFDLTTHTAVYGSVNINNELRRLTGPMQTAIYLSGVKLLSWRSWKGAALLLTSMYGC
jgi:hypothetical protein